MKIWNLRDPYGRFVPRVEGKLEVDWAEIPGLKSSSASMKYILQRQSIQGLRGEENTPGGVVRECRRTPPPNLTAALGIWMHRYNPPPKVRKGARVYENHQECEHCGQFSRGREDFDSIAVCDSCWFPLN